MLNRHLINTSHPHHPPPLTQAGRHRRAAPLYAPTSPSFDTRGRRCSGIGPAGFPHPSALLGSKSTSVPNRHFWRLERRRAGGGGGGGGRSVFLGAVCVCKGEGGRCGGRGSSVVLREEASSPRIYLCPFVLSSASVWGCVAGIGKPRVQHVCLEPFGAWNGLHLCAFMSSFFLLLVPCS